MEKTGIYESINIYRNGEISDVLLKDQADYKNTQTSQIMKYGSTVSSTVGGNVSKLQDYKVKCTGTETLFNFVTQHQITFNSGQSTN